MLPGQPAPPGTSAIHLSLLDMRRSVAELRLQLQQMRQLQVATGSCHGLLSLLPAPLVPYVFFLEGLTHMCAPGLGGMHFQPLGAIHAFIFICTWLKGRRQTGRTESRRLHPPAPPSSSFSILLLPLQRGTGCNYFMVQGAGNVQNTKV